MVQWAALHQTYLLMCRTNRTLAEKLTVPEAPPFRGTGAMRSVSAVEDDDIAVPALAKGGGNPPLRLPRRRSPRAGTRRATSDIARLPPTYSVVAGVVYMNRTDGPCVRDRGLVFS